MLFQIDLLMKKREIVMMIPIRGATNLSFQIYFPRCKELINESHQFIFRCLHLVEL